VKDKYFRHTELSDKHKCKVCGKGIKIRLVRIKENPPMFCYMHWLANKRNQREQRDAVAMAKWNSNQIIRNNH